MKKITINLLLFLTVLMALTACAAAPAAPGGEGDTVATPVPASTPEPAEEPTTPAEVPTPEAESTSTAMTQPTTVPTEETTVITNTIPATATLVAVPTMSSDAPEGVIMIFRRTGGIAGFCDTMTIMPGTVRLESCNPNFGQGEMALDPDMEARLLALQEQYAMFTSADTDAPGAADAMTLSIEFYGTGAQAFTPEVEEELMMIGRTLLDEAGSLS